MGGLIEDGLRDRFGLRHTSDEAFGMTATPIAEGLRSHSGGWMFYAVSQTGSLFYSTESNVLCGEGRDGRIDEDGLRERRRGGWGLASRCRHGGVPDEMVPNSGCHLTPGGQREVTQGHPGLDAMLQAETATRRSGSEV